MKYNNYNFSFKANVTININNCTAAPISSLCSVLTFHFGHFLRRSPHFLWAKSRKGNHVIRGMNRYVWSLPLKYLWSIYRKLAWVGFEPTTTEFHSDALTNWAIRLWVQLRLRTNFVQLLQFQISVQYSHFVLAIVFVSRHICFKQNLTQVITLVPG